MNEAEPEPTEEQWKKTRSFLDTMLDILQPTFDRARIKLKEQGVIFEGKPTQVEQHKSLSL